MNLSAIKSAKITQNWLGSLIFFFTLSYAASGQMRLQWHWDSFPATAVKVTATLYVQPEFIANDTLSLQFAAHSIQQVRLRQGRLKQALPFRQHSNVLKVALSGVDIIPSSAVEISYRINLKHSNWKPYLYQDSSLLILSPYNLNHTAQGPAGLWYPALANKPLYVQTDVKLPLDFDFLAPGAVQFRVQGERYHAAFRQMEAPLPSQRYYLAVGKFDQGTTARDLDKEMELSQKAKKEMVLAQTQMQLKDLDQFLRSQNKPALTDSLVKHLSGEVPHSSHPLLNASHPWVNTGAETYYKQYAALHLLYSDSLEVQQLFWDFIARHRPLSEQRHLLDSLWSNHSALPLVTRLYARQYATSFPDTVPDSLQAAAQNLFFHIKKGGELPRGTLAISYKKGQQQFWLMPNISPVVPFPLSYRIFLRDSVVQGVALLRDTVRLNLAQAPSNFTMEWWNAPVRIELKKPDYYWLRSLQNASSTAARREALEALLHTQNRNLLATVLGIAMDAKAPRLRLLALQNYPRLNAAGKNRLKSTLQDIAIRDSNAALRQMAGKLLQEND